MPTILPYTNRMPAFVYSDADDVADVADAIKSIVPFPSEVNSVTKDSDGVLHVNYRNSNQFSVNSGDFVMYTGGSTRLLGPRRHGIRVCASARYIELQCASRTERLWLGDDSKRLDLNLRT